MMQAAIIDPNLVNIEVVVPDVLKPVLESNRHLIPKFHAAIGNAVRTSFEHPDTRVRGDISRSEVQLRVGMCVQAVVMMYFEEKLSLIHCFDILTNVLIDAIRAGYAADAEETGADPRRWGTPAPMEVVEVADEDILAEGDDILAEGTDDIN